MKTLNLIVTKHWFDLIASGEKELEYREVKPFWISRLTYHEFHKCSLLDLMHFDIESKVFRDDFDLIEIRNGYGKKAPVIFKGFGGIDIGKPISGLAEEGWLDTNVFIITLKPLSYA